MNSKFAQMCRPLWCSPSGAAATAVTAAPQEKEKLLVAAPPMPPMPPMPISVPPPLVFADRDVADAAYYSLYSIPEHSPR